MRRRAFHAMGVSAVLCALYLLFWPIDLDPVKWKPPKAPRMEGAYAQNSRLAAVVRIAEGVGRGPEDIAFDAAGRLYTGYEDGRIVRFAPGGVRPELFAKTGGRPLGLRFDNAGNLIVADAYKGLLRIAPNGKISVLATTADGVKFGFTDHLAVAPDGTIYFTDASSRHAYGKQIDDIFEHHGNGRLMALAPGAKTPRVLMGGLQFANGVAVSSDGRFVLVAETGSYRVRRYWVTGAKAGTSDTFIANLPGFPDNIYANGKGVFWIAMYTVRNKNADRIAKKPYLRKVIWRLRFFLVPRPKRYGLVLGLDETGKVIHNLQDKKGGYAHITSAVEQNGMLYLGSLSEMAIGRIKAP